MNERVDPLTIGVGLRQVGLPYPDPCPPGLRLDVRVEGDELRTTLVLGIDGLTEREAYLLVNAPIQLGILHSPPITWVTLRTIELGFDAPYTLGLEDAADVDCVLDRLAAFATRDAPGMPRLDLHCVDTASDRLVLMRRLGVSEGWMLLLARSLAANSDPVSSPRSRAAIQRDFDRWPSLMDMAEAVDGAEVVRGGDTSSWEVAVRRS